MHEELIDALRTEVEWGGHQSAIASMMRRAADALEAMQAQLRPKREDECLTLDDWRFRAMDLEANWSRCSQACARVQGERDELRLKIEAMQADAMRWRDIAEQLIACRPARDVGT